MREEEARESERYRHRERRQEGKKAGFYKYQSETSIYPTRGLEERAASQDCT